MNVSRWRWSFWLFAGVTLVGLAGWQIAQITVGEQGLLNPPKPKLPPTKLRSAGRVAGALPQVSSDPVAAYVDRAKRGMTEQEIRWMIEDYQHLGVNRPGALNGLTPNPNPRPRQQYWYLLALTEGLNLNAGQKAEARTKMGSLLRADQEAFEKGIAGVGSLADKNDRITDDLAVAPTSPAEVWLAKDAYQPWNLSTLTAAQEKLTLKAWRDSPAPSASLPTIQDPATDNLIEFPSPGTAATRSFQYLSGSRFFPLTPDQAKLSGHLGDALAQARLSHPAQLRMALLLEPALAPGLLHQLDSPLAPGVTSELPLTPEQPPVATDPEPPSE